MKYPLPVSCDMQITAITADGDTFESEGATRFILPYDPEDYFEDGESLFGGAIQAAWEHFLDVEFEQLKEARFSKVTVKVYNLNADFAAIDKAQRSIPDFEDSDEGDDTRIADRRFMFSCKYRVAGIIEPNDLFHDTYSSKGFVELNKGEAIPSHGKLIKDAMNGYFANVWSFDMVKSGRSCLKSFSMTITNLRFKLVAVRRSSKP